MKYDKPIKCINYTYLHAWLHNLLVALSQQLSRRSLSMLWHQLLKDETPNLWPYTVTQLKLSCSRCAFWLTAPFIRHRFFTTTSSCNQSKMSFFYFAHSVTSHEALNHFAATHTEQFPFKKRGIAQPKRRRKRSRPRSFHAFFTRISAFHGARDTRRRRHKTNNEVNY